MNENFKALADAVDNIATGVQGPIGPEGLPGTKGDTGTQGSTGPAGLNGLNGALGPQGPKGEKGDPGSQGIQGPAGTNGTNGSPDTADQVREKFLSGTSCTDPNNPTDMMVKVGPLCIDKYEASVWLFSNGTVTQFGATVDDYGGFFPDNGNWLRPRYAVSKAGVKPSRFITWFQAQQACFLSGKRLLTNAEWQAAAGTPEPGTDNGITDCAVSSALSNTGSRSKCVSKWGVHDMVGNLWEWVADWQPSTTGTRRIRVLTRGGRWIGNLGGPLAGVFVLDNSVGPSISISSLGFRCAR